jgi:glycosyltransferase involved in cell wall biosynthesis
MADTLETSITSVAEQLNEQFEIIIVDDGSTDNSVGVLRQLKDQFPMIRIVELQRDPKRMLGATRNISVENANGEYVLLHIDCDDIYGAHIVDYTNVFHQIEQCIERDILLSGQHINMGKRSFLMEHGPYRNIFYTEDRDMWIRFASFDAHVPFDHINFVTRLPKTKRGNAWRSLVYTWRMIQNDFRSGATLFSFFKNEYKKANTLSFKLLVYRAAIVLPVYISSKFHEKILIPENMNTSEKVLAYRNKTRGSFSEIMARFNRKPDYSGLSEGAEKIFI